jgi:hypothetical protein
VIRRVAGVALAVALLSASSGIGAAFASTPVRPNQHFIGLVNGKHTGAVVYTVCPGPGTGDGPPAGGQTVAVHRVKAHHGDTGPGARVIYAVISSTVLVALKRYDQPEPIPTSARVPCQGSGTIEFSTCPLPQPCPAGAKPDNVAVQFVDIAAG